EAQHVDVARVIDAIARHRSSRRRQQPDRFVVANHLGGDSGSFGDAADVEQALAARLAEFEILGCRAHDVSSRTVVTGTPTGTPNLTTMARPRNRPHWQITCAAARSRSTSTANRVGAAAAASLSAPSNWPHGNSTRPSTIAHEFGHAAR